MMIVGDCKVLVQDSSATYACNALAFKTAKEAQRWGEALACRWFALRSFAVVRADLAPDVGSYYSPELVRRVAVVIEDF